MDNAPAKGVFTECQSTPELWYSQDPWHIQSAKDICFKKCPLRSGCLGLALDLEQGQPVKLRFGVWGGMSPTERKNLELRFDIQKGTR